MRIQVPRNDRHVMYVTSRNTTFILKPTLQNNIQAIMNAILFLGEYILTNIQTCDPMNSPCQCSACIQCFVAYAFYLFLAIFSLKYGTVLNMLLFLLLCLYTFYYTSQTKFGGIYRNHPVRPSMYLVSAIPPKRLIGFL